MNKKLEKIRLAMASAGMDALFVTSELNQRYLLEYAFTDGMLVVLPESAYMITDFRYYEEASAKANKSFRVEMPSPRLPFIIDILKSADVKTVGYESSSVSCDQYDRMSDHYKDFVLLPAGEMIENVREVKEQAELDLMAKAQEITDAAFSHILEVMSPEMTEIDVALELEFFMRHHGAEGLAFDTIAVSGDASALPHGKPRNVKLKKGFLTMDFGAKYEGYCADMTRTVSVGKADAKMKKLYDTVLSAQLAGLETVRAGIEGKAADKVARDIIDVDYAGCFGHSLGHGVGMFIHESPRLASNASNILVPGNVVTVEPGIYVSGKYGCRIEDMVAIKEDGCMDFTHSRKDLIELF